MGYQVLPVKAITNVVDNVHRAAVAFQCSQSHLMAGSPERLPYEKYDFKSPTVRLSLTHGHSNAVLENPCAFPLAVSSMFSGLISSRSILACEKHHCFKMLRVIEILLGHRI